MNGTFLEAFELLVMAWDITFDYEDNHIMCFPHVINICSTHVIKEFTNVDLVDDSEEFDPSLALRDLGAQTYEQACACDPIALCHGAICAICASGQHLDYFAELIRNGNEKGWFLAPANPDKIIKVPQLQLLCDVKTHWDSIYFMIRQCRAMHPVCGLRLYIERESHSQQLIRQSIISCHLPLTESLQNFS
jgi:hypothetical protein